MSRELKIENQLDSHLKQIKVGETATPIEISTKKIRMNKDLICVENIEVEGGFNLNSRQIQFPDQIVLESSESIGGIQFTCAGISVLSALWAGTDGDSGNNDASLTLFPSAGQDAKIIMYGNAALQWTIGNDNDDSDKLKFDVGTTTVGGATKMTLDDSGNLTLVGDLAVNGDDITTDGDMNLDSGGSLTLDAHDGNFIAKKAGTEFSAANSAYAGMILGYTRLQGDGTNFESFEIQNSITVEDDTHKITFKTPPSENVEIKASFVVNRASTDTTITVALSDADASTGYNSIGELFEYDNVGLGISDDEVDDEVVTARWALGASELASIGSSNTFWIGVGTGGATKTAYLQYGLRASHGLCLHPFIIKASALPTTIYDGQ